MQFACKSTAEQMMDYTFENLCFDIFADTDRRRRWFLNLPASVRPDKPQGFGPLPNEKHYAEVFNQYVRAVNKLDKARVWLPHKLQCRYHSYQGVLGVAPDWPPAPGNECTNSANNKGVWSGSPPAAGTLLDDPLDPPIYTACGGGIVIAASGGFDKNNQCIGSGPQFRMVAAKNTVDIDYSLVDPLAIYAVPEALRDMLNTSAIGFLGFYYEAEITWTKTAVSNSVEAQNCNTAPPDAYFFQFGTGYKFEEKTTVHAQECRLFQTGTIDPGAAPAGDFFIGLAASVRCGNSTSRVKSITPVGENTTAFVQVPLE